MEHPDIKLQIEMTYDPEIEGYEPQLAGLADDSPCRDKMDFDECVEAIMSFVDFLAGYNLLGPDDHPDDMDKVSRGSEQLLLDALCIVHSRWDLPILDEDDGQMEEDLDDFEEADFDPDLN